MLKGRAASPIRPGLIAKNVLMGKIPLDTGEYVNEAAVTDIFKAYKSELDRVNELRPRDKHIRGMRYSSFYTMFRFAILKGLVEYVRGEEADYNRKQSITASNVLLRVEKVEGEPRIVVSNRKIFKLSDVGYEDEKCWSDLTNSWKLNWGVGQKLEYEIPTVEEKIEEPPEKIVEEEKPLGFTSIAPMWKDVMTIKRLTDLIAHLRILLKLGVKFPGVSKECDTISLLLADWVIDMEDRAQSAKTHEDTVRYENRGDGLNRASEELAESPLTNDNILVAITALEGVLKS